jgi:low temperature requirement protein LtrA
MASSREAEGRSSTGQEELRVTTLELFFDLVFVFTLTQLTALLAADPSGPTAFRVILVFIVLFWMYGGYVWLTNQVPPDRTVRRILIMVGMAAFLVCALAIPEVFDGTGVAFGLGYLLVILVHLGLYAQVAGVRVVSRFAPFNVIAAGIVTVAGFLDGAAAYGLWLLAIAILFVTPRIAGRVGPQFTIRPGHFVERHGLLLIVAFGESVVAIGIGIGALEIDLGLFAAAVLGLALAGSLWWAYFVGDEEGAHRAMARATPEERFPLAINAFFFSFIPMLLGIIAVAAGVKLTLGHIAERLELGPALVLGGGAALFLAGDAAFRTVTAIRPVAYRAAGAGLALGTVPIGLAAPAGWQLVALVAVVVGTIAAEARWRR